MTYFQQNIGKEPTASKVCILAMPRSESAVKRTGFLRRPDGSLTSEDRRVREAHKMPRGVTWAKCGEDPSRVASKRESLPSFFSLHDHARIAHMQTAHCIALGEIWLRHVRSRFFICYRSMVSASVDVARFIERFRAASRLFSSTTGPLGITIAARCFIRGCHEPVSFAPAKIRRALSVKPRIILAYPGLNR